MKEVSIRGDIRRHDSLQGVKQVDLISKVLR